MMEFKLWHWYKTSLNRNLKVSWKEKEAGRKRKRKEGERGIGKDTNEDLSFE